MGKESKKIDGKGRNAAVRRKKKGDDRLVSASGVGRASVAAHRKKADVRAYTSDSDPEEDQHVAMRKVSTHKQIKSKVSLKEGYLLLQTSTSFQRWRRHYFKLRPRLLFHAKTSDAQIFDEVALDDCSVAERSTKNVNCSFSIITPFHNLILCAESRREMDEWISAIKAVQAGEFYEPQQFFMENFSGGHNWYTCTHARPMYCNVCREVLSGVMNQGVSCEVCKFKAHKRCAAKAVNNCKWATLSTVGTNIIEDEDGIWIPHQWMEGNLPVSAKCVVCDKTCGSVLRLQDWRCLWCKAMVHTSCRSQLPQTCSLGPCKMSILPPAALNSIDSDGFWQALSTGQCFSPLLVFVNSKSGDNQGVKFFRRFRQHLNPAQVFDLMCTGPRAGLRMFQKFDSFRILVCGGDGSIGWVLSEMDKMNLHKKAQVGVLPLGTGNDLAQVMGWGNVCDDDTQVPTILERYERAGAKLLDRWSIMTYEGPVRRLPASMLATDEDEEEKTVRKLPISDYELTVANHLSSILNSDQNSEVIKSSAVLCETIRDFVSKVKSEDGGAVAEKCETLDEKLNSLLTTLNEESRTADEEQKRLLQKQQTKSKLIQSGSPVLENVEESVAESVAAPEIGDLEKVQLEAGKTDENDGESPQTKESKDRTRPKRTVVFRPREQLMLRANSLKKAIRQIVEHTERAIDEQNAQTLERKPLATQPEEDETAARTPLSSTTSDADAAQQDSESDRKRTARLSVGSVASVAGSQSVRARSQSLTSSAFTNSGSLGPPTTFAEEFPKLSPKVRVKHSASTPTQSSKSKRRSSKSTEEKGCSHVNPDYAGGSFIGRVLLANADALCAAASPLINFTCPIMNELFVEKCVMNNYFGIGLDAKIALDFHRKREDHPKKCSRTKNRVWYGMLATKEFALKTYKNLDQRIRLECDGQHIPLPRLQGIVVLNIPSFMGGARFWGGRSGTHTFVAPSYNDKVLEVVAVFGTMQLGMAMVAPEGVFQQHRIAQCRRIKITILGDEGVPLQVDGEAWLQMPGVVKIEHKNRAQMLLRDRRFEETLKSWEGKQQRYVDRQLSTEYLSESELDSVGDFVEAVGAVAKDIRSVIGGSNMLTEELLSYVTAVQRICCKMLPGGSDHLPDVTSRSHVTDLVTATTELSTLLANLFNSRSEELGDMVPKFVEWLEWIETEMKKVGDIKWLSNIMSQTPDETSLNPALLQKHRSRFRIGPFSKKTPKRDQQRTFNLDINVNDWTVNEVSELLDALQLAEYKEVFSRHDVRGKELLKLDSADIKAMGISKVGHIKRILNGIKDLQKAMNRFSR